MVNWHGLLFKHQQSALIIHFLGVSIRKITEYIQHKNLLHYISGYLKILLGGQKILDTHLGSGSSRIAAYHAGLDFYGCELDKEYFDKMNARFEKEIHGVEVFGETIVTQQSLFE